MTDNQILAAILVVVLKIEKNTRSAYDTITGGEFVCDSAHPYSRQATPLAVKTVVLNLGPETINISEGGKLIASAVAVDETWESPTNGSGVIAVSTDTTSGSTIRIATYANNT